MSGRKPRNAGARKTVRPASGNRLLLVTAAILMLAGIGMALSAGLGAALRIVAADMPIPALAGWQGALAGAAMLLLGFALANAGQRHWPLAGGWALVAAGAAAMLLAPSVPALAPVIAVAGGMLVGWQFARRLGPAARRRR